MHRLAQPDAYTGAKLVRDGAIALSGDGGIQDIRGRSSRGSASGRAAVWPRTSMSMESFSRYCVRFIDPEVVRSPVGREGRPLKVVVDGGNGMAGPMVGPLLEGLGLELIETYWTPDGTFPDHEPNPLLEENREAIVARVRESGADLGIAWDGDADRCFFIDDTGEFVDGDFLTALLAQSLLGKATKPGEAVLYDVRASRAVPTRCARPAASRMSTASGHAFLKTRMRKEGSLFGGEVSGHYYFREFYCADSGTIPALLVLRAAGPRGSLAVAAAGAVAREVLHLGRDQLRGLRSGGEDGRAGRTLRRCPPGAPGRHLDRL